MLQAQLSGKLTRTEENMEDLLTSNVFGSISYVSPQEGLIPLLTNSRNSSGKAPPRIELQKIEEVKYDFWPWEKKGCYGCEPDVRITVHLSGGSSVIIFVEAKYFSPKSSTADEEKKGPYDQLAREWDNLQASTKEGDTPMLLYITADLGYPMDDFLASKQDYLNYTEQEMDVYWISWRNLPKLFSNRNHEKLRRDILRDLAELLRKKGLTFFEGISVTKPIEFEWSFTASANWDWSSIKEIQFNWKYEIDKTYNWNFKLIPITWRFQT
jgi:hypothetical protein